MTCKEKYLCAYVDNENKCYEYFELGNVINRKIELPDEIKKLRNLEANNKLISGINSQDELVS